MNNAFITGFLKQAQIIGINRIQAERLFKVAVDWKPINQQDNANIASAKDWGWMQPVRAVGRALIPGEGFMHPVDNLQNIRQEELTNHINAYNQRAQHLIQQRNFPSAQNDINTLAGNNGLIGQLKDPMALRQHSMGVRNLYDQARTEQGHINNQSRIDNIRQAVQYNEQKRFNAPINDLHNLAKVPLGQAVPPLPPKTPQSRVNSEKPIPYDVGGGIPIPPAPIPPAPTPKPTLAPGLKPSRLEQFGMTPIEIPD